MAFSIPFSAQVFYGNNSVSVKYPVTFPNVSKTDIRVAITAVGDDEPTLLSNTQFTVHEEVGGGYSVTTTAPVINTSILTVFRHLPLDQPFMFPEGGAFPVREVERAIDRVVMLIQQVARAAGQSGTVILPGPGAEFLTLEIFADAAARALAVPGYEGQIGVQLNPRALYIATGIAAGQWAPYAVDTRETNVFANPAARALAVPKFIGQIGVQLDPRLAFISTGLGAGAWVELETTPPEPPVVPPLDDRLCLAYFADAGEPGEAQTALKATIDSFNPDYLLAAGDLDYLHGDSASWSVFISSIIAEKFLRVRGNHGIDTPEEIAADAEYFGYLKTGDDPWWSRVLGNGLLEIFGIETGEKSDESSIPGGLHNVNGAQYAWLENGLKNSTARHKIVMFHQPPVSCGSNLAHDVSEAMAMWVSVLARADAVLCGHVHLTEWLAWRGVPVINFSGAVRQNGTSRVQPNTSDAYPLYLNDVEPLVAKITVTAGDVVVEGINVRSARTEFIRSIYDKTPRAWSLERWVFPPDVAVVQGDGDFHRILLTITGVPIRINSVVFYSALTGSSSGHTVQLYAGGGTVMDAGGEPVTQEVPFGPATYISGEDILRPWLPIGTVLTVRYKGWSSGYGGGVPARGLCVQINGDTFA